jgi:MFS family permease
MYRDFLRTPYALRLLGGTLLGRLPNGMATLAILLFVRHHGGGYSLGGLLTAMYVIAMAVGQPLLGRVMDKRGQFVLLPAAVLSGVGFALPVVTGLYPLPVTFGAILLAGFATPPLESGLRALWPVVLTDEALVGVAYGLDAAAQELLYVTGPLLVIAAAVISPEAALLLTAVLGLLGTLVVITAGPSRTWRGEPRVAHWAGPLRSGGLRVILGALVCVGVALGAFNVAAVGYGDGLDSGSAAGILLAANAGGAFLGGLAFAARGAGDHPYRLLPWLVTGLAAGYLPLASAPSLVPMTGIAVLSGLFLAPVLGTTFTLVDRLAPRGTVTEAFAWVVTAMAGGAALGSAIAGRITDLGGSHAAFAVSGGAGIMALAVVAAGRALLRPRRYAEDLAHRGQPLGVLEHEGQ